MDVTQCSMCHISNATFFHTLTYQLVVSPICLQVFDPFFRGFFPFILSLINIIMINALFSNSHFPELLDTISRGNILYNCAGQRPARNDQAKTLAHRAM